jgi:hypothetical protein
VRYRCWLAKGRVSLCLGTRSWAATYVYMADVCI